MVVCVAAVVLLTTAVAESRRARCAECVCGDGTRFVETCVVPQSSPGGGAHGRQRVRKKKKKKRGRDESERKDEGRGRNRSGAADCSKTTVQRVPPFNDSKSPPPVYQPQFWGYMLELHLLWFKCGSPPSAPPVPFPGAWPRSPFPVPLSFRGGAPSFRLPPRTRTRRFQSAPLLSS